MSNLKKLIDNNIIAANVLAVSAMDYLPKIAALKGISEIYQKDANGNKTDTLQAITYHCVNTENYHNFSVKTMNTKRIITQEQLDEAPDVVFIEIPVEETIMKPYEIAYGKAKVSIIAPYVKLWKGDSK